MTNWASFYNLPVRGTPMHARCDVCGRKDETVVALVLIGPYDPAAPASCQAAEYRRCPTMCTYCLADEPSQDELACKAVC